MNPHAFIAFAKKKEGQELLTLVHRKKFFVDAVESTLGFTPDSGIRRPVPFSQIKEFCEAFEERRSFQRSDYPESRHGSYLVTLAHAFQKENRPNKPLQPTPGAVTPRAAESVSK